MLDGGNKGSGRQSVGFGDSGLKSSTTIHAITGDEPVLGLESEVRSGGFGR